MLLLLQRVELLNTNEVEILVVDKRPPLFFHTQFGSCAIAYEEWAEILDTQAEKLDIQAQMRIITFDYSNYFVSCLRHAQTTDKIVRTGNRAHYKIAHDFSLFFQLFLLAWMSSFSAWVSSISAWVSSFSAWVSSISAHSSLGHAQTTDKIVGIIKSNDAHF